MGRKKTDGLSRWQRCRLKDLQAYRKKKREYARTPEQRAVRSAYMAGWKKDNPERTKQLAMESYHRNKHKHVNRSRNYALLRSVGINLAEKIEMIERQGGRCRICDIPFVSTRHTHVDHNHGTGIVRGILCNICNTKLGWFEKYRGQIIKYLE